jgi:hypothetical protein
VTTRVIATAILSATCRHELREQLRLSVDPTSELERLNAIMTCRRLTLRDLQQLISAPSTCSLLGTLAPVEFSRVRARLEGGSRSALETTATDLQTELGETLAVASAAVTAAARGITANTFAESGLELGYAVAAHHAGADTFVELRRGHEIVLVGVHDGGTVEFDHGGLTDDTCREHQLELERAAQGHGVIVARRFHPGE